MWRMSSADGDETTSPARNCVIVYMHDNIFSINGCLAAERTTTFYELVKATRAQDGESGSDF
jgi:hypothetical protein